MNKSLLLVLFCAGALAACNTSDLTGSGGGGGTTALNSSPSNLTETPAEDPPSEPPPPVESKECGVGRYEFRTDADNKFHFDAFFAPGGVIRYNFSVQPNTGNWRVSGNSMTFNGPFGNGAANHTSTWTITGRASDCSVLQFKGNSYGQAAVTATRI